MKNIAVIPLRSGSKRLPKKNYKSFNSKNLVQIARDKCLEAGIFDKIIISSDDTYFEEFVNCDDVQFILRKKDLANDDATTDKVVDFFFEEFSACQSILWVNSVSPLQSVDDIRKCGIRLMDSKVDCVMATNTLFQHCSISNIPINFDPNNPFEKTQDLEPVQRYIYSCMGWKRDTYLNHRNKGFRGLFPGKMSLVEVSVLAGMLIKHKEDFVLCSKIEEALNSISNFTSLRSIPNLEKLSKNTLINENYIR